MQLFRIPFKKSMAFFRFLAFQDNQKLYRIIGDFAEFCFWHHFILLEKVFYSKIP